MQLSFGQERLWLEQQIAPASAAYNITFALQFEEPVDYPKLSKAFKDLVTLHPTLGCIFSVEANGIPTMSFSGTDQISLAKHDKIAEYNDWQLHADSFAKKPFDLSVAPPIRALLIDCSNDVHILCIVVHHIIIDGHSIQILCRDLVKLYKTEIAQTQSVSYNDFVIWQRAMSTEKVQSKHLDYWCEDLKDFEKLELFPDRSRRARTAEGGDFENFDLSVEITKRLKRLTAKYRCTMTSVVGALYASLLSALSGQQDITIGTALNGRSNRQFTDIVGFFVNTVALRIKGNHESTFRTLLETTNQKVIAAHEHQQAPFEKVVAAMHPKREFGRNPIFDVAFVYNGEMQDRLSEAITTIPWTNKAARFDLELSTHLVNEKLSGTLVYSTAKFDKKTISSFLWRFMRVAELATDNPDMRLAEYDLLSKNEKREMEKDWKRNIRNVSNHSLATAFRKNVKQKPKSPAVFTAERSISYSELDHYANRLTQKLVSNGVRPEDLVGLLTERGSNTIIGMLAIIKAGAAYLPLSIHDPAERHRSLLRTSGVATLLSDQNIVYEMTKIVDFSTSGFSANAPEINIHPDQLAHVIYTSGSTGEPKGVAIAQRQITDLALDRSWDKRSNFVMHHSAHNFDATTYEVWITLLRGGCIVVAPPGHVDIGVIKQVVQNNSVTEGFVTEGLFRLIADEEPAAFRAMHEITTGGDIVSPQAVRNILEACPGTTIINAYGPTETTCFATTFRISDVKKIQDVLPIGKTRENMRCYVLNPNLRLVPNGVVGEIYIAGSGLSRGYSNRPDLTATKFVADPYGPPGSRMYRTGDYGSWQPDGLLQFHGRIDSQIKIRGNRVEIGEVESILCSIAGVRQAIVIPDQDYHSKVLSAYVVPQEHIKLDQKTLLSQLGMQLPSYAVPRSITLLNEIPITANGKIHRSRLPKADVKASASIRIPSTPFEKSVSNLYAQVLERDSINLDDNFFELGGHSLLAARLVSNLNSTLGLRLSVGALFQAPTVFELCQHVESGAAAEMTGEILRITSHKGGTPIFFIHPGIGMSWCYAEFAKHLSGFPIYALQAQAISDTDAAPPTLEKMACDYIQKIQEIWPNGPYRIAGWSFGANVAQSIACQLRSNNFTVELLTLIDGYPFAGSPPGSEKPELDFSISTVRKLHFDGTALSGLSDERVSQLTNVLRHNASLAESHKPKRLDCYTLFFEAKGHPNIPSLKPEAWNDYLAGKVRKFQVDVGHYEMMSSRPLEEIAKTMMEEIDMLEVNTFGKSNPKELSDV